MATHQRFDLSGFDDDQLLERLVALNHRSAELVADLLCHLAEVDSRALYLGEGCRSLWTYAIQVLGCSEDEASRRIRAARAGQRFPVVFEYVARGDLSLTAVSRLARHLTAANHETVLWDARGKTLEQIDELLASLAPRPDVASRIARLPERGAPTLEAAMAAGAEPPRVERGRVEPLSPGRWGLRVTIGAAAREALREAQDLLRNTNPSGDAAPIVEQALIEYAARLASQRRAKLRRSKSAAKSESEEVGGAQASQASNGLQSADGSGPLGYEAPQGAGGSTEPHGFDGAAADASREPHQANPSREPSSAPRPCPDATTTTPDTALQVSRRVPDQAGTSAGTRGGPGRRRRPSRAVMRAVIDRDGGRCTFEGPDHRRCTETSRLEFHHLVPYAAGGETTTDQLTLRCRAHHDVQTRRDFGDAHVTEAIARRRQKAAKRRRKAEGAAQRRRSADRPASARRPGDGPDRLPGRRGSRRKKAPRGKKVHRRQ